LKNPADYDADNENIDLLKLKSFIVSHPLKDKELMSAKCCHEIVNMCSKVYPLKCFSEKCNCLIQLNPIHHEIKIFIFSRSAVVSALHSCVVLSPKKHKALLAERDSLSTRTTTAGRAS
jgi:hypothetical protein